MSHLKTDRFIFSLSADEPTEERVKERIEEILVMLDEHLFEARGEEDWQRRDYFRDTYNIVLEYAKSRAITPVEPQ
jgi:hypothetical protein